MTIREIEQKLVLLEQQESTPLIEQMKARYRRQLEEEQVADLDREFESVRRIPLPVE